MRSAHCWFILGCLFLNTQTVEAEGQQALSLAPATLHNAIPFQLRGGFLILIEGRIGSLARVKFILDTGTTNTIVDRHIADQLSLERRSAEVLNFNRRVPVEWAKITELQVGPLVARNLQVMVGDLKQLSEFADGVDGIIGMDVMQLSQVMRIDYDLGVVSFRFADESNLVRRQRPNSFTVRLPVQGRTMLLMIDTGVEEMFLYKDRVRKHLPQLKFSSNMVQARSGSIRGETSTLPGIRLGNDERQASVFLIDHASESLPADIDGYMGTGTLHARTIELDFASNHIRWQ